MGISLKLTNQITVPVNAPKGTVIGTLVATNVATSAVDPCDFGIVANPSVYFALTQDGQLLTNWKNPLTTSGNYNVSVYARSQDLAAGYYLPLNIILTAAVPTPTAISFTPASVTLTDISPTGTFMTTASVTMSDGSQFTGTLSVSGVDFVTTSGLDVMTSRDLTAADDGSFNAVITATQGVHSFSMRLPV